jgi:DnaK suppressor protein
MRNKLLRNYRNMLTQRVQDLLLSTGHTVQYIKNSGEPMPDPCDKAFQEFFYSISFSLGNKDRQTILETKEAIKRIDEGTFGICERCGRKISEKRLTANPSATLCIECKRAEEKLHFNHGKIPMSVPLYGMEMY